MEGRPDTATVETKRCVRKVTKTQQFSVWPRTWRVWRALPAGAAAIRDENRRGLETNSFILLLPGCQNGNPGQDPFEERNLIDQQPQIAKRLLEALESWWDGF